MNRAGFSLLIASILFVVVAPATWIIAHHRNADLWSHAVFLQQCLESRVIPEALLFYLTLAVVTGFSTNLNTIMAGMGFVLGMSIAARYWVSIRLLRGWRPAVATVPTLPSLLALAGITFVFCFPIPGERWMLPHIPPNYWHNSTSIFVMPFVVLLFAKALDFVENTSAKGIASLTLLVALNVLSKPSFFLCFIIAYPLYLALQGRPWLRYLGVIVPLAVGVALLGFQYFYIYQLPAYRAFIGDETTHIAIGWFHVWSRYVHGTPAVAIPLVIANSILLPIALALSYPKAFFGDRSIRFSLLLLGVAIAIYAVVYETGLRMMHGNFGWQPSMCNYLLHVCSLGVFVRVKMEQTRWTFRDRALLALFVAEVAVGLFYLFRLATTSRGAA